MDTTGGALSFDAQIKDTNFEKKINEMEASLRRLTSTASSETDKMHDLFMDLGKGMLAFLSIEKLKEFGQEMVNVRGIFEQMQVAFEVMLQSKEKSDLLMEDLIQLAAYTPFSLIQVNEGAQTLIAFGEEAETTGITLRKLGDIASGTGKDIGRLVETYGKSMAMDKIDSKMVRQWAQYGVNLKEELAKVMQVNGQNASKDSIEAWLKDGSIKFNDLRKVVDNLTTEGGRFEKMMERQAQTIPGLISNLGDAYDEVLNGLGKSSEGIIKGSLGVGKTLLENYEKIIDIIKVLVITYGAYKAALIVTTTLEQFHAANAIRVAVGMEAMSVSQVLAAGSTNILSAAMARLNTIMAINPWVAASMAIAAIIGMYVTLGREADHVKDYHVLVKEAEDDVTKSLKEEHLQLDPLIRKLQSHNIAQEEKLFITNKINDINPKILEGLKTEADLQNKLTQRVSEYYAESLKVIKLKTYQNKLDEAGKQLAETQYALELEQERQIKSRAATAKAGFQASNTMGIGQYGITNSTMTDQVASNKLATLKEQAEKAQTAWNEVMGIVEASSKAVAKADEKVTPAVVTAGAKIMELQDMVTQYTDLINRTTLDAAGETERKRLDILRKGAEEQIKLLKGEYDKSKVVKEEDPIKPIKDELEKKKAEYHKYYEALYYMEEGAAKEKFASLIKNGDSYTSYLQSQISVIEGKITSNSATKDDWNKLLVYKPELSGVKNAPTVEQQIKDRIGNVKDAASLGRTSLEEIKQTIAVIDDIVIELQNGGSKYKSLNPDERAKTISELATQKQAQEKEYTKQQMESAYELSLSYKDYGQQKLDMATKYEDDIATMTGEKYAANRSERLRQYKTDLADLSTSEAEQKKQFAILGIEYQGMNKNIITQMKTLANEAMNIDGISDEKKKEIQDYMDKISKQMSDTHLFDFKYIKEQSKIANDPNSSAEEKLKAQIKLEDTINGKFKLGVQLTGQLADAIRPFNEGIADSVQLAGQLMGAIGELAKGNYIGAALSAIATIGSYLANQKKINSEAAEQDSQNYTNDIVESMNRLADILKRQEVLISRAFGVDKIAAFSNAIKTTSGDIRTSVNELNELIAKHNELIGENQSYGPRHSGSGSIITTSNGYREGGTSTYPKNDVQIKLVIPTFNSYASLEAQIKQLKDMEKTMTDLNDYVSGDHIWKDEEEKKRFEAVMANYEAAYDKLLALKNAKEEYLTGATGDSVSNAIITGFENGMTGAAAFADNFEELMKKAVLNSLKLSILDPQVKEWMANFALAMQDNQLTDDEKKALKEGWDKIITNSQSQLNMLEQVSGIDVSSKSNSSSLTGDIKAVSETTAGVLAGQLNGMRINQTLAMATMQRQLIAEEETAMNTRYLRLIYSKIGGSESIGLNGSGIQIGG